MGEPDVARVDVAAVLAAARQYDAAADIVDSAVRTHLTGLAFDGAAAGRVHVAHGDALRVAHRRRGRPSCRSGRAPPPRSPPRCVPPRTATPTPMLAAPGGWADRWPKSSTSPHGWPRGARRSTTSQTYVWACHLLGYQNPDLTLHAAQVRDWYGSEDGLDLRALDADCAALRGGRGGDRECAGTLQDATARRAVRRRGRVAAADALARLPASATAKHRLRRQPRCAHGRRSAGHAAGRPVAAVDGKVAAAVPIDDRRRPSAPSGWPPRRR